MTARRSNITPLELALLAASSFFVIYATFSRTFGIDRLRDSLGGTLTADALEQIPAHPTLNKFEILVGKSITRVARLLPGNHNCLSQAIAAKRLLQVFRRESRIVIGLDQNRKSVKFESHAWLITHHGIVVGGEVAHRFTPVSIYSNSQASKEARGNNHLNDLLRITKKGLRKALREEALESIDPLNPAILELVEMHRVSGFIWQHGDFEEAPKQLKVLLSNAAKTQAFSGLTQALQGPEISSIFSEFGIRHVVIKGSTLAVLTGRGMSERGGGDVDLLVQEADVPAAHRLLLHHGFSPKVAFAPREGFAWRFWAFRDRELTYKNERFLVDLHWRVSKNGGLTGNTSAQVQRSVQIEIGGRRLPSLYSGDALIAASVHNYLDFCQNLRGLIDIVFLSNHTNLKIPGDAPREGKQLLADTLEFARALFGRDLIPAIDGLPAPSKKGVAYLLKLWHRNSLLPLVEAKSTYPGSDLFSGLAHALRYNLTFKETLRYFAKVSLAFPAYQEGRETTSIFGALYHRILELVLGKIPHIQARRNSKLERRFLD